MINRLKDQLAKIKKYDGMLKLNMLENMKSKYTQMKDSYGWYGGASQEQRDVIDKILVSINTQLLMKS